MTYSSKKSPDLTNILYTDRDWETKYAPNGEPLKRAFTYKALNRLIQGSAADMTKKLWYHYMKMV